MWTILKLLGGIKPNSWGDISGSYPGFPPGARIRPWYIPPGFRHPCLRSTTKFWKCASPKNLFLDKKELRALITANGLRGGEEAKPHPLNNLCVGNRRFEFQITNHWITKNAAWRSIKKLRVKFNLTIIIVQMPGETRWSLDFRNSLHHVIIRWKGEPPAKILDIFGKNYWLIIFPLLRLWTLWRGSGASVSNVYLLNTTLMGSSGYFFVY